MIVILGGAGFIGSHLAKRLDGYVIDNHSTGHGTADMVWDVTEPFDVAGPVSHVLNFASPASPADYLRWPVETLRVGAQGTWHGLELARRKDAVFMLASTSEVYGDPLVNPQPESYWGNVNPVGPRGVYDEAKRYAEALTLAYDCDVRIARIFNTYGPGMRLNDGRAVPEFIRAARANKPLPVHGDGSQTRSLCFIDDMVEGLIALLRSDVSTPVNLGNPEEVTVLRLAELCQDAVGNHPGVEFKPRPVDDPAVRCPDISLAQSLGWNPVVPLRKGLQLTCSA